MWKTSRYIGGALDRVRGLTTHSVFKSFDALVTAKVLNRKQEIPLSHKKEKGRLTKGQ